MFVCQAPLLFVNEPGPRPYYRPMTVALRPALAHSDLPAAAVGAVDVAGLDVLDDLAAAEPAWRALEDGGALSGPFQRFEWIAAWQQHVGIRAGVRPLVVVGRDRAGAPVFVWPFVTSTRRMLTVARFFGGSHSNLNVGLWRRDIAASIGKESLLRLLGEVAARRGIDLFVLRAQPLRLRGVLNPFSQLGHQPSPDDVYVLNFAGSGAEQVLKAALSRDMRGRLRQKERKLASLPGYRYFCAATPAEVARLLDAFFFQKSAHFAEQGIHDVFARPGVAEFLRAACRHGLADGRAVIELHAIEADGEPLAVMGGVADRHRFSCMFSSYTVSEHGRWSPGLVLLRHLVANCADRGLVSFDLGAGHAPYKLFFCRDTEQLFDSFVPFSLRGRLAAAGLRAGAAVKARIKAAPVVVHAVHELRRRFGG